MRNQKNPEKPDSIRDMFYGDTSGLTDKELKQIHEHMMKKFQANVDTISHGLDEGALVLEGEDLIQFLELGHDVAASKTHQLREELDEIMARRATLIAQIGMAQQDVANAERTNTSKTELTALRKELVAKSQEMDRLGKKKKALETELARLQGPSTGSQRGTEKRRVSTRRRRWER